MTATMNHMNGAATQTNDPYLARAEAILVKKAAATTEGTTQDLWSALVQRANISHALEDLLEIPDNSRERLHGAVRRVLNTISHEYNIVVHGPEVHDSTPAVIFASHRDSWFPGLLLYLESLPQSNAKIEPKIGDKTRMRFNEILHLVSVGKLTSPEHIIEVVYDFAETESDVLHRDITRFNVMCQAEHHPATNATQVLAGIPCVKTIFGDENGEPAVLLVDLDHAAHADRIWKPGYVAGIEHTGTPMFIALELSGVDNDNRVDYTRGLDTDSVEDLTEALTTIESHNEISQRAFHGDSGKTFMDNFTKVIVREKARRKARPRVELYSDPRDLHRTHHDVQSMYWTLLWSFAGALPKGSEAYSKAYLDSFCHFMLTHELGYEGDRLRYLKNDEGCRDFLHDRLRHFGRLFRSLGLYLSIPWHVYVRDGTVKIDHAHHAIRRLLLRELIFLRTPDGKKLNLALDTTQPRMYMPKSIADHRQTLIPNQLRTAVATTQGTGAKRKFDQTSMDSQCEAPDAKRAKVGEAPAEETGVEENSGKAQAQPRGAKVSQENFR